MTVEFTAGEHLITRYHLVIDSPPSPEGMYSVVIADAAGDPNILQFPDVCLFGHATRQGAIRDVIDALQELPGNQGLTLHLFAS